MRFFLELTFKGTRYAGWQRQSNALTVQEETENSLSLILREPVKLTGCGRTDTGVHARQFYTHFDCPRVPTDYQLRRVNRVLPYDISIVRCWPVPDHAHARFDAFKRTYEYNICRYKDPFREDTVFRFPHIDQVDVHLVVQISELIKQYKEFYPFSKSRTDVSHYACEIFDSDWDIGNNLWTYRISANRFLRGMVRLIVGLSLNAGVGKLSIDLVKESLETQTRIPGIWSVPARGLFLTAVEYPLNVIDAGAHREENLP